MQGVSVALVLFGLLAAVWGQSTNVSSCIHQGDAASLPLHVFVKSCSGAPCSVHQLDVVEMDVFFRSPRAIDTLASDAVAYLFGPIGVRFDLGPQSQACNHLSVSECPLKEGQVAAYHLKVPIESYMPVGAAATVEFLIRDASDQSVVTCFRLPIRVMAPIAQDSTLIA